jgi:hypothetical protein
MHWATNSDRFSSLFICIFTPLYLGFPLAIAFFLYRRFDDLQTDQALFAKFEALVASIKSTFRAASLYIVLFLLRRLVFALSLVFLTDWPLLQVNLLFLQSLSLLLYLLACRPFDDPVISAQELFNELCILGVTYPSLLFSGYLDDPLIEYQAGWYIVGVIGVNLTVNMSIALVQAGRGARQAVRRMCMKVRLKRKLGERRALEDTGR